MNVGLPILASDIPPLLEVLHTEDGREAGIVLSIDSVDPWVDTIRNLMGEPSCHARWAKASRDRAKDFSPSRMVDHYEACFSEN